MWEDQCTMVETTVRFRPPSLCLYRRLITDCSNCCLLLLQTGRNSGPGLRRGRSEGPPPPDIAFTTPLHLTPALSGIGVNLLKHFPNVTFVQVLFKLGDFSFVQHLLAVWKQGRAGEGRQRGTWLNCRSQCTEGSTAYCQSKAKQRTWKSKN